jgi:beta-N-acetylhexosaminidase
MLGIEGAALTASDDERLRDPLVGGVILFTRNYASRAQPSAL